MEAAVRQLVWHRADNRCEYCRLPQDCEPFSSFHVDHIIPKKHGGDDGPSNLCLSCAQCNLGRGSNLSGIDGETGAIVELFHPRVQTWQDHFALQVVRIVGLTPTGRATVAVLNMNDASRLELRRELRAAGMLDV